MKCKITNDNLKPFMSFGKMPSANGFLEEKDFQNEFFYEMEVGFSEKVSLLQLNEFSNPEAVHNERYPFYTSSSRYMTEHFKNFAKWLNDKYLSSGSKLVEIGSNDGTFLENFKNKNIDALGYEPSSTIANLANKKGIKTFDKFFNRVGYGGGFYDRYIKKLKKRKKIVTIGLAYSFQKVKKIPINHTDIKLDFIITEKNKIK